MNRGFLRIIGLLTIAPFLFSGCATNASEQRKRFNNNYEYVYVTGSNLRIKVRKGERAVYKGTSPTATMDSLEVQETFQVPQGTVNSGI